MNKSIFKLFGMSALVLSAILGGLSIADRPLVLEAHALSREQEKGVHLLSVHARVEVRQRRSAAANGVNAEA